MAYDSHCDICESLFEEGAKRFTLLLNKWVQVLCQFCFKEISKMVEEYKFSSIYGYPVEEEVLIRGNGKGKSKRKRWID